jgi:hypothetical protein
MGSFFQPGNSIAGRIQKKIIPKELRRAVPKEINPAYLDKKSAEKLDMIPPPVEGPPGIPPSEQIDSDAYRLRDRQRRRARGASTIRTSSAGAAYSPAPRSLLGG